MRFKLLATALALTLMGQAAYAVPTVGFDPNVSAVQPGDTFVLTLQGWDFDFTGDSKVIDNVTGGQKFNLEFDPTLLQLTGVVIDSRWTFTSGNKVGVLDAVAGTVTGLAFGTFPATTDDAFNIAQLTFKSLGAGNTLVSITGGEIAAKVNGLAGAKILPAFEAANVSMVPEPEQWAMMLAGLGLVGWKLRKH